MHENIYENSDKCNQIALGVVLAAALAVLTFVAVMY